MTVVIGLLCSDGVVLATDSAATYAAGLTRTIRQPRVSKIAQFSDTGLVAFAGAVGIAQCVRDALTRSDAHPDGYRKADSDPAVMQRIAAALREAVIPHIEAAKSAIGLADLPTIAAPVLAKSIVACVANKKRQLISFSETAAPEQVTDELPFVAIGSGQPAADLFLAFLRRVLWPKRLPSVAEGRLAAAWTVHQVVEAEWDGVGGAIQVGTLALTGGRNVVNVSHDSNAEHGEAIAAAESCIRDFFSHLGEQPPAGGAQAPPK